MSKNTRNRILLTALAAMLLVVVAVGGTMAYLQAQTSTVTNTFSPSGIGIKLDESTYNATNNTLNTDKTTAGNTNYQLIPGRNLPKDPVVTILDTTNVAVYVFLTIDKDWTAGENGVFSYNGQPDITFTVDTSVWTVVPNQDHVYYKAWSTTDTKTLNVIKDTTVVVGSGLTETDMAQITSIDLSFHAYAIQQQGFSSVEAAWTEVMNRTDGGTTYYTEI